MTPSKTLVRSKVCVGVAVDVHACTPEIFANGVVCARRGRKECHPMNILFARGVFVPAGTTDEGIG